MEKKKGLKIVLFIAGVWIFVPTTENMLTELSKIMCTHSNSVQNFSIFAYFAH